MLNLNTVKSKKTLSVFSLFLFAILILTILPLQVAADCCVYQGVCTTSSSGCPPASFRAGVACVDQSECQMGCCCQENVAKRRGQCLAVSGNTFTANSALSAGAACSCQTNHAISGTVLLSGTPAGSASVAANGIISQTNAGSGQFTLLAVPSGPSVTISASLNGCFGNATLNNFNGDVSGVTINLVCSCTPGCDIAVHSYCDAQGNPQIFDVTDANQRANYCQFCASDDAAVCGTYSQCKPGDGVCPLSCSATNDADCVCNINTRNGVCPVGCTDSNDLDCRSGSNPQCGDGIVSYPFETCEQNPQPGQASLCAGSGCNSCNCVSTSTCGNGVIDAGESCELGNICSDGSTCTNCACGGSCSGANINPALSGSYVATSRQARLSWALTNSCGNDVVSFEVWKCLRSGSNTCVDRGTYILQGTYSRSQLNATDLVLDNSVYHYFVRARYSSGSTGSSSIVQVTTGSSICTGSGSPTGEFCLNDRRSRCNANNNVQVVEDCQVQGRFCTGPDATGTTVCTAENACSMCNGLYGMFARYLDLRVTVGSNSYFCNAGVGREVVPGCYLDESKSIFEAFNSCGNIRSCYDYKSEDACTDPADPCGKNAGCEWASFPGNPSLGGVCRPRNSQIQDCTLCDNSVYNALSPKCTPDTCRLFGACYYQGINNTPSCSSNRVSTCNMLTSVESCEGPTLNRRSVNVSAIYNSNLTRIGGTHALIPSNDNSSLGKCYWDSVNLRCRRDADNLRVDLTRNVGFDCQTGDVMCESDFVNPLTSILGSQLGAYRASPVLFYSVQDVFSSSRIKTYFCVARVGSSCYPNQIGLANAGDFSYSAPLLNASGLYTVYYYSVDPAQNLELVKNTTILVDADAPFIDILRPSNFSEIAFNNLTMPIEGRTSTDTSFLCANNTYTRRTVCINNCQKPGAGTPCIGSQGFFNMSIALASGTADVANVTRNIQFYAEDYAGNRYSNTMLGILFDITPPALPTIVVR